MSFARTAGPGETTDVFGKQPRGFITYGSDGRMMVLIVEDRRPKPANPATTTDRESLDLFRTMAAYGGTYTFDGITVIHHVDISWNEEWTGTDQARNVEFDGDRLILSSGVYVVTWEKVKELPRLSKARTRILKGQRYQTREDIPVSFLTHWAAPFTGSGGGVLTKGTIFTVASEPRWYAITARCIPENAASIEKTLVSQDDRNSETYQGFTLLIRCREIRNRCDAVPG